MENIPIEWVYIVVSKIIAIQLHHFSIIIYLSLIIDILIKNGTCANEHFYIVLSFTAISRFNFRMLFPRSSYPSSFTFYSPYLIQREKHGQSEIFPIDR